MPRKKQAASIPPIERFPTTPRADGRYQKRIHGRLYYFGRDGDRVVALREYDRVKHALYAGVSVSDVASDDVSVKQIAFRVLDEKLADAKAERIAIGTYHDYVAALDNFCKFVGERTTIRELRPDHFAAFARHLLTKRKLGPHAYNRERACIRAAFRHAEAADWIETPVKFGKGFPKASAAELRLRRRNKLVPTGVIQSTVRESTGQLRAMILLASLGGYGAGDCAALERSHVDLDKAIIRFPRPKTLIQRVTPLPDETVDALAGVMKERPNDSLVFRTKRGNPWVRYRGSVRIDAIAWEWVKLQRDELMAPVTYPFYAMRHTFATVANEMKDGDGVRRLMGHSLKGLDDVYVETIGDERLRLITDHVRSRLLPSREMVYA